jgi:hypothetical protein
MTPRARGAHDQRMTSSPGLLHQVDQVADLVAGRFFRRRLRRPGWRAPMPAVAIAIAVAVPARAVDTRIVWPPASWTFSSIRRSPVITVTAPRRRLSRNTASTLSVSSVAFSTKCTVTPLKSPPSETSRRECPSNTATIRICSFWVKRDTRSSTWTHSGGDRRAPPRPWPPRPAPCRRYVRGAPRCPLFCLKVHQVLNFSNQLIMDTAPCPGGLAGDFERRIGYATGRPTSREDLADGAGPACSRRVSCGRLAGAPRLIPRRRDGFGGHGVAATGVRRWRASHPIDAPPRAGLFSIRHP